MGFEEGGEVMQEDGTEAGGSVLAASRTENMPRQYDDLHYKIQLSTISGISSSLSLSIDIWPAAQ